MKIYRGKTVQDWKRVTIPLIALMVATTIAACGGDEATPTPQAPPPPVATAVPSVATAQPTSAAEVQAESPLDQPESPLLQPESPLNTTENSAAESTLEGILRNEDDAIALAANTEAPEPGEGFGAFSGLIYSFGGSPGSIPGTPFYLVEAAQIDGEFTPPPIYTGPNTEEDVYGMTAMSGQVQVGEVPPGNYYIAVWTLYGWLLVFPSPDVQQSPRLITIEEGDQQNLGVLYVDWP